VNISEWWQLLDTNWHPIHQLIGKYLGGDMYLQAYYYKYIKDKDSLWCVLNDALWAAPDPMDSPEPKGWGVLCELVKKEVMRDGY